MFVVLLRMIWLALTCIAALGVLIWQVIAGDWVVGLIFTFLILQLGQMFGPTRQEREDLNEYLDDLAQRKADRE